MGRSVYGDDAAMPPPPPPPPPSSSARYAYLVSRLRNRQITMDEATELFDLQQSTLSALSTRIRPSASGSGASAAPPPTASAPAGPGAGTPPTDDAFWMGLLAAGAGAGLLAAILKRNREPPASGPAAKTTSPR